HHAITGLLFSHAELWDRPPRRGVCSFAFVHDGDRIGFGWVGYAGISLSVDGHPHELRRVTIRDETGREGYCWSTSVDRAVQVGSAGNLPPADPPSPAAGTEAGWGGGHPVAGGAAPEAASPAAIPEPPLPPITTEPARMPEPWRPAGATAAAPTLASIGEATE